MYYKSWGFKTPNDKREDDKNVYDAEYEVLTPFETESEEKPWLARLGDSLVKILISLWKLIIVIVITLGLLAITLPIGKWLIEYGLSLWNKI